MVVCTAWSANIYLRVSSAPLRGDLIEILLVSLMLMSAASLCIFIAVGIRSRVRKEKRSYGVPDGAILYSDLNVPAAPLFSQRLRLSGKPDYIVQKQHHCTPVEVKSGGGTHPHQSQVLQLAAYCQILEDVSGMFVPEGILVYNAIPYRIPFDPKLRFELESVMKTMRECLRTSRVQRNHQDPRRCQRCSMKQYCTESIIQENP